MIEDGKEIINWVTNGENVKLIELTNTKGHQSSQ